MNTPDLNYYISPCEYLYQDPKSENHVIWHNADTPITFSDGSYRINNLGVPYIAVVENNILHIHYRNKMMTTSNNFKTRIHRRLKLKVPSFFKNPEVESYVQTRIQDCGDQIIMIRYIIEFSEQVPEEERAWVLAHLPEEHIKEEVLVIYRINHDTGSITNIGQIHRSSLRHQMRAFFNNILIVNSRYAVIHGSDDIFTDSRARAFVWDFIQKKIYHIFTCPLHSGRTIAIPNREYRKLRLQFSYISHKILAQIIPLSLREQILSYFQSY